MPSARSTEDHKLVRIILTKSIKDASNCWKSLLVDTYAPDPFTLQNMEKKLTLERFQKEVFTNALVFVTYV